MDYIHIVNITRPGILVSGWQKVYNLFGGNELMLNVVGTWLVVNITFWSLALLHLYVDLTKKPNFIWKYKVQQNKNAPLDPLHLPRVFKTTLFNMVVMFPPTSLLLYPGALWRGNSCSVADVPTIPRILFDLMVSLVFDEIVFYYSHRLLHHPYLYKRIHKKHHEWTAPFGLVAVYAHPIEHLLSNTLTGFAGSFVAGSHLLSVWIWLVCFLSWTVNHHSGYHLPFSRSAQFHDFHHARTYCNFGALGILDYLHGTDSLFQGTVESRRDKTYFSLTPISETIPDTKKN
uniref:Fatty acid hydroxylase domain-containing protein 2-like n=1 Tax=Saccoglossus kowalevskii TaxID=10224 RepID=A0ABM0M6G1_SACKO|nr:PREDICTED: fatty acid hydroxylase domain-containing protein 2-like [Saccoglossus kowalevskii]